MKNYQWNISSKDENEEMIDFTSMLEHTGKVGHGLCGKDADLDHGGQVKVQAAFLLLDHDPPYVMVRLSVYANICQPEEEAQAEIAEALVIDCNEYPGEWTGSDYWTFTLQEGGYELKVDCPHIDPLSEVEEIDKGALAEFIHKTIFADEHIKRFRTRMTVLAKDIDTLSVDELAIGSDIELVDDFNDLDEDLSHGPYGANDY